VILLYRIKLGILLGLLIKNGSFFNIIKIYYIFIQKKKDSVYQALNVTN